MTRFKSKSRVVDAIYLNFSKLFSTVYHNICVTMLGFYALDGQISRCVKNLLDAWAQSAVVVEASNKRYTTEVCTGTCPFKDLFNYLEEILECVFVNFAGEIKPKDLLRPWRAGLPFLTRWARWAG